MEGRRTLSFTSLDQSMAEVDRLLAGHRTVGNWSLGQVCNHLAESLRYSVEGGSLRAPWPVRLLLGPILKRRIFGKGKFPEGIKLPEAYGPKPGLDARAEAEALRASIRVFAAHVGPMAFHPLLGPLTSEQWRKLHCLHAAHHLGFVLPDRGLGG